MRIGIDAHHINGKPQGSRTHLIQLIRALSPIANGDELRVYSFRPQETRTLIEADAAETITHHRVFPESARLRLPFVVPALELLDRLSVFHSQYIAPPLSMVPEVVTIHDVLFETHPDLFEGAFSRRSVQLIRRSARRSRVVLTVSEFSRQALIQEYGLSEDKVLVTPNAVDRQHYRPLPPANDGSFAPLRARYGLDAPFVLTVGRLEPRKNLERLIRAFARMRSRIDTGLSLVLVGAEDFRCQTIMEEARALPEGAVRTLGTVPDADLPGLYNLAEAVAYPSLVEGFGMPVLESMACGTPVMTAPRGAIPEVGGDAVLWIDPEDEAAMEHGLERILSETSLREALRAEGLKQADRFSWAESAQRTLSAYRMAANH